MAVAQISLYFSSYSRGKDSYAIVLPFTGPCSYSSFFESQSSCSVSCRQNLSVRCLRNGKDHHGNFSDTSKEKDFSFELEGEAGVSWSFTSINVKHLIPRKLPRWGKVVFRSKKLRSIIMLNLIAVVYASNIPVVKEVQEIMDPAAFSAVRFTIAAIPFLPFVIKARDCVETRKAGMELGFWMSLGCLIEALGLLTAEAGRASFLSLFTVLVVPVLSSMLGEIVPARTWFGVLISILGITMLECTGSPPNIGDLLNFLSAIFFGVHTLRTEHLSRSTRKENFLALLGYEVCVLAVLSNIWCLVGGSLIEVQEGGKESWTWPLLWDWMVTFPWIPALYTGVFSTGIGLWAEIDAMRNISATETAVIYGMEPLWGAGFAWFLLGERWGAAGWIGAALMLGGSLMVQIFGASPPGSKEEETANQENDNGSHLSLMLDRQKLPKKLAVSPIVIRSKKDAMKRS